MERLKIEWYKTIDNHSEGFMELNLDAFFPCTVKKANKIFTLVRRWCPLETIADLEKYFLKKSEQFKYIKHQNAKWDRMLKLFYAHTSDLHTHTHQ